MIKTINYNQLYNFWGDKEWRKVTTIEGEELHIKYVSSKESVKRIGSNAYFGEYQGSGILKIQVKEDGKKYVAEYGVEGDDKDDLDVTTTYFEFEEYKKQ